jgi:hypothetical protein
MGAVRRGRCQHRDTVPPTSVRLTHRALEGGPAAPSSPLFAVQGQTVTSGRREHHPRRCQSCAGHPRPCSATSRTTTTTPTLLGTRGRDAATPATVPRTDQRLRLPRAHLETPRSTTTPSPSKPPCLSTGHVTVPRPEQGLPGRASSPRDCTPYLPT